MTPCSSRQVHISVVYAAPRAATAVNILPADAISTTSIQPVPTALVYLRLQEGFETSREREAQAGELARVGAWVDSWIKFDHMASNYVPVTRFVAMMYVLVARLGPGCTYTSQGMGHDPQTAN